jgi:hypothetical protein
MKETRELGDEPIKEEPWKSSLIVREFEKRLFSPGRRELQKLECFLDV